MLKLIKLDYTHKSKLFEMMGEWTSADEKIVPYSIRRIDYQNFDKYIKGFEEEENGIPRFVPGTTLFCMDIDRKIFVGAVNIRYYLNESLLLNGGHIGDGIRPSERRKGYATKMIGLALDECRKLNLDKILMVCDKSNIGSAKSIIKNGGILENEIETDGNIVQRYWIRL